MRGTLKDALLDGVLGDEAEDVDLLGLADTVCTVHGLEVGLGVPVAIEQNDNVGGNEVDTETTRTGCQKEDELFTARGVVLVNRADTVLVRRVTVDTAVLEVTELAVVLENVKHTTHLREDEDARALGLHRLEKLVEDDHLAGVVDEVLVGGKGRPRLGAVED